jgi:branched-chain amino acid transport system ATP-binding protein
MFAGLTVRENLLVGGYSRRRADLAPDLERIYGLFPRLAQRTEQAAGRLSGGEQQMVAIGRALMARPRLLIIDELSQGLAPTVVDDLIDLLPTVARDGTAILLVEQDVEAALAVAARAYVLELGSIVREGPAAELRGDPSLTAAYLGG